jgi:hypothetical protein
MHGSYLQEILSRWISLDEQTSVTQEGHLRIRHKLVVGRFDALVGHKGETCGFDAFKRPY